MIAIFKQHKILTIVVVGFILRMIGVLLLPSEFVFPDSQDYHEIAGNILNGEGFVNIHGYYAARPPLYPFMLATLYSVGLSFIAMRMIQVIVSALTIFVVYLIAKEVTDQETVPYLAASLMALDPFLIGFSGLILTETFFIFLLTTSILITIRVFQQPQDATTRVYSKILLVGFTIGLATLLRTSLLPYIVGFVVCAAWYDRRLLLAGLIAILMLVPWTVRNKMTLDRWIPLTTKSGVNFYEALGPGATGGPRMDTMSLPKPAESMGENERDIFLKEYTLEYLRQNPSQFFRLVPVKFFRFWNPDLNNEKLRQHFLRWVFFAYNIFLYVATLIGLYYFRHIRFFWLLLLPVMYYTAIHCVFLGSVRYRIPIMPFVFVFTAQGLSVLLARMFEPSRPF